MITPKDKDKVLSAIIACNKESGSYSFVLEYDDCFPDKEINCSGFNIILEHFLERGLLKKLDHWTSGSSFIHISVNLFDFFSHGGFVAQEEILRANLEKLDYELTKLSKENNPEIYDSIIKISGIAASIATALGLFR